MAKPPPPEFFCPITGQLINVPAVTPDGNSFEYEALDRWLRSNDNQNTSPLTRNRLSVNDIDIDHSLWQSLREYRSYVTIEVRHMGGCLPPGRNTFQMPLDATVQQFKRQIQLIMRQDRGVAESMDRFRLACRGRSMLAEEKLEKYDLSEGGTVFMVLRLGGHWPEGC